ncbi:MAG: TolC family protein, partial [Anaerotignaceae bacterium]
AYGFTYNNEDGISALITLVNTQVSLKNSLISQNTTNESLKYSLKQTYVDIIVAERNIALSKENLKTAEKNLNIAKIKNRMGTLSDIELKEQQLSYDQSVLSLEQQEISLEANYISLNILMGVDVNNRYSFDLSLEYEPLELAVSIESYMTAKVAVHPSVIKAQNSLQLATDNFNLNMSVGNSSDYTNMKNNIATAGFNLEDTKDSVSQSIRTLYNTIIQREKSIDTSLIELETLKEKLETTKLKYEAGMASENEFLTAKQNVANKEYSIISNLYSHMLEVEKFNNPDLI